MDSAPAVVAEVVEQPQQLKQMDFVRNASLKAIEKATELAEKAASYAPGPVAGAAVSVYERVAPTLKPYAEKTLEFATPRAEAALVVVDTKVRAAGVPSLFPPLVSWPFLLLCSSAPPSLSRPQALILLLLCSPSLSSDITSLLTPPPPLLLLLLCPPPLSSSFPQHRLSLDSSSSAPPISLLKLLESPPLTRFLLLLCFLPPFPLLQLPSRRHSPPHYRPLLLCFLSPSLTEG